MSEMKSFEKLLTTLTKIEAASAKIEEHWAKTEGHAGKAGGAFTGGTGGQRNNGGGNTVMPSSRATVAQGKQTEQPSQTHMTTGRSQQQNRRLGLANFAAAFSGAYGSVPSTFHPNTRGARVFGSGVAAEGVPAGGAAAGGGGKGNRGGLPTAGSVGGARSLYSSNFGISDTLSFISNATTAGNQMMPDVSMTMNRATGYYNAGVYGGNVMSRDKLRDMTYGTMSSINGLTSAGSDAATAQYLAGRGMTASAKSDSVYQQTLRSTANAARYMNISNEEAVSSIEGLTSAKGSAKMLQNFGIYTADLNNGKEKTQGQIFEELAGRLTAGRGQADVEQTQKSIRRGALGVTIDSFFEGDEQGGRMFKQYMIDRAGGKNMDLSQNKAIDQVIGNKDNINPLNNQMTLANKQAGAMNQAEPEYVKGINVATKALGALTDATGGLVKVFGTASSLIQTLFGNDIVKGATSGLTSTVDYASKGVSSAMGHLFSMDLSAPQFGSFVPETMGIASDVANMAIGFGTMAAAPGVATMLGAGGGPPASAMADSLGGGLNAKGGPGGAGPLSMPGSANGGGAIQTKKFNLDYLHSYRVSTKLGDPAEQGGTHKGTDFVMSEGTDLKAIADGEVTKASGTMQNTWNGGSGPVEMGGEVNIVHQTSDGKQYTSIYGHMSKIYVSKGQQVTKGQVIGKSGNSGYSSGAHLHFEVREGVGRGGRSMPLSEVSSILDNGSRGKDNGGWDDQGANAEGDTPDNTAVYKALAEQAVKDGSNQIKMPSQATAAMATLKGLYSGNTQSILGSVQNMAKNMGVSQANWQSYMNAADVSAHNTATAPAASDALERTRNNNVSNNVSITVQVPDVTSGDAVKFAQLVKQYLDNDSLQSTTGSI